MRVFTSFTSFKLDGINIFIKYLDRKVVFYISVLLHQNVGLAHRYFLFKCHGMLKLIPKFLLPQTISYPPVCILLY